MRLALPLVLALGACSDGGLLPNGWGELPYASEENAQRAALECGVKNWNWTPQFVFDGPQKKTLAFQYEIESLPGEEVASDEGRTWDRTKRITGINNCLCSSFEKQGVRIDLASPALVETIIAP